jgi:hypothetical protein
MRVREVSMRCRILVIISQSRLPTFDGHLLREEKKLPDFKTPENQRKHALTTLLQAAQGGWRVRSEKSPNR